MVSVPAPPLTILPPSHSVQRKRLLRGKSPDLAVSLDNIPVNGRSVLIFWQLSDGKPIPEAASPHRLGRRLVGYVSSSTVHWTTFRGVTRHRVGSTAVQRCWLLSRLRMDVPHLYVLWAVASIHRRSLSPALSRDGEGILLEVVATIRPAIDVASAFSLVPYPIRSTTRRYSVACVINPA